MRLILAFLASVFLRVLRGTWRVRLFGPDPFSRDETTQIFCFWHGRQVGLFAHPRRRRLAVLTSLSRDGSLQSKILGLLGFHVLRGSSSRRGAAGLKGLIDALRNGRDGAFAVDGPHGPARKVKPGAVLAARRSGANLIPITTRYSASWKFPKSWDHYAIPKPFARVDILRGQAIPAQGLSAATLVDLLEQSLLSLDDGSAPMRTASLAHHREGLELELRF